MVSTPDEATQALSSGLPRKNLVAISGLPSLRAILANVPNQTDLLSLNTAIETARAGMAGEKFAAVADEIKTTSRNMQKATESARELFQTIYASASDPTAMIAENGGSSGRGGGIGGLPPGGQGPYDPNMEDRVARLESGVAEIKAILGRMEPVLAALSGRLSGIEGKLSAMEAHDQGVDARLDRIENRLSAMEAGEKIIETRLGRIEEKTSGLPSAEAFGEIKGRVATLPSLMQVGATMLAINAGIVALSSLIVALLRK